MLELYHHGSSVCAAKARLVLEEKGIGWTGHYLDILRGDQFTPDYLKLNPKAVVPTLVHDGRVVRESTVICEYLDETFPDKPLKPADAYGRAQMRLWTKRIDEEVFPMCAVVTFVTSHRYTVMRMSPEEVQRFLDNAPDPEWRERKRGWVTEGFANAEIKKAVHIYDKMLADMETALADAPYLAGESYSLADVNVTPFVNRLDMLSMSEMWTKGRPRVTDWFARIKHRANFKPAILDPVPAQLADDLRTNGARSWPQVREILAG